MKKVERERRQKLHTASKKRTNSEGGSFIEDKAQSITNSNKQKQNKG